MGFRIPRKSSDEVRSAGKYRSHIPYIYKRRYTNSLTAMLMSCICQPCSDNEFIIPFKISTARKTWQRRCQRTGWSAHFILCWWTNKIFLHDKVRMWTETNNNGMLGTVALDSWGCGRQVVPHWRFLRGEDVGAASYCPAATTARARAQRRRRSVQSRQLPVMHYSRPQKCS